MIGVYHQAVQHLRAIIEDELPNSRERSLALTKLDEMEMWVNKADANNVFEEAGVDRATGLKVGTEEYLDNEAMSAWRIANRAREEQKSVLQQELPEEAVSTPAQLADDPQPTESILVRAANALIIHQGMSEASVASFIKTLNDVGIYLRDK